MSVVVKLPVALIMPSLIKLPPRMLPVAVTPPTPALIPVVADKLFAVTLAVIAKLPPAMLAALVMLPVELTSPAVIKLPPVMLPITVAVPLANVFPDTANVCNGAVFATPTLPTSSIANFAVAAAPFVEVSTSYLAFPVALVAIDLTAVVTLALGEESLVNHSTAPNTVLTLSVVSVSLNLNVGWPRLASLVIETFPVVSKFPKETFPAITPLTCRLPMTAFPVTLAFPATFIPLDATTSTLLTPPTLTLALPLATGISIEVVPLNILSPAMLPVKLALPLTLKSPLITTDTALAVGPMNETDELAARVSKTILPVARL